MIGLRAFYSSAVLATALGVTGCATGQLSQQTLKQDVLKGTAWTFKNSYNFEHKVHFEALPEESSAEPANAQNLSTDASAEEPALDGVYYWPYESDYQSQLELEETNSIIAEFAGYAVFDAVTDSDTLTPVISEDPAMSFADAVEGEIEDAVADALTLDEKIDMAVTITGGKTYEYLIKANALDFESKPSKAGSAERKAQAFEAGELAKQWLEDDLAEVISTEPFDTEFEDESEFSTYKAEKLKQFFQNFMPYAYGSVVGSFEPKNKTISVLYAAGYDNDYLNFGVKVPVWLDYGNYSLTLDPGALESFIGLLEKSKKFEALDYQRGNAYQVKIPEDMVNTLPVKALVESAKEAGLSAYNSIPDQRFNLAQNDSFGSSIGATQAVSLQISAEDQLNLLKTFLSTLSESLETNAQSSSLSAEQQNMLAVVQGFASDTLNTFDEADFNSPEVKELMGDLLREYDSTLYFDAKGQLIGMKNVSDAPKIAASVFGNSKAVSTIRYYNKNKPVNLLPTPKKVVDLTPLIEEFGSKLKKF